MKFNQLLEELIVIAKKSKTDLALSLDMSPSGLSKILSGRRVPSIKERRIFTKQAADYFAEAIFGPRCYIKFERLFPVIYEFESLEELQGFLSCAITYALDDVYAEDGGVNLDFSSRAMYVVGRKPVLDHLCILLSEQVNLHHGQPQELFASFPLHSPIYFRLLRRVILLRTGELRQCTLNYFFDGTQPDSVSGLDSVGALSYLCQLQREFQLCLHRCDRQPPFFLLIKGRLLLMFNTQIDGTLLLLPIHHKSHMAVFHDSLMKGGVQRVSYTREEVGAYLEAHPQAVEQLAEQGIDSVYNFLTIGYLLHPQELERLSGSPAIRQAMAQLFEAILSGDTKFYVSLSTMERFKAQGDAIVPFLSPVKFPLHERAAYLRRFDRRLTPEHEHKIGVLDMHLPNLVILVTRDYCFLYTLDDNLEQDRVHLFQGCQLGKALHRDLVAHSGPSIRFSQDVWDTFNRDLMVAESGG